MCVIQSSYRLENNTLDRRTSYYIIWFRNLSFIFALMSLVVLRHQLSIRRLVYRFQHATCLSRQSPASSVYVNTCDNVWIGRGSQVGSWTGQKVYEVFIVCMIECRLCLQIIKSIRDTLPRSTRLIGSSLR
jgi:hypothetical protein